MKSIHISLITFIAGLGAALAQTPSTAMESPLLPHPQAEGAYPTVEWGVQNCSPVGHAVEPPYFDNCELVIRKEVGVSSYEDYLIIDRDGNLGLGENHMQSNFNRERTGDGKALGGTHDHTMKIGMDKNVSDPGFDENIIHLNDKWTNSPFLPEGVEMNFSTEIKAGYLQIQQTSTEVGVDPRYTRIEDGRMVTTGNVYASLVDANDFMGGEVNVDQVKTGLMVVQGESGSLFASKGTTAGPSMILSGPNNNITLSDGGIHTTGDISAPGGKVTADNVHSGLVRVAGDEGTVSLQKGGSGGPSLQLTGPDGSVGVFSSGITTSGTITADIVEANNWKITAAAGGPDYVFSDPNYKRKSLDEIEGFIEENNHLPGVPSAKEMAEEGYDLAEMNFKLLEQIENLVLQNIDQQKVIQKQEERLNSMEAFMKKIEKKAGER